MNLLLSVKNNKGETTLTTDTVIKILLSEEEIVFVHDLGMDNYSKEYISVDNISEIRIIKEENDND